MDYNELREVGKFWILMTVFSTCFFASCGQNPTSPPESATPVSHTKPVAPDMEPQPVSFGHDYEPEESYSKELEGTGYGEESSFGDLEHEISEFTEDIPAPQQPSGNSDKPSQEVSSNRQEKTNAEVARDATSTLVTDKDKLT